MVSPSTLVSSTKLRTNYYSTPPFNIYISFGLFITGDHSQGTVPYHALVCIWPVVQWLF